MLNSINSMSNDPASCLVAPAAFVVVDVRPQSPAPPPAPGRPRSGPSMFAILRAQRFRRVAKSPSASRQYGALPQSDSTSLNAASRPEVAEQSEEACETDTDESMV